MIADANAIGDLNRASEHGKPVLDWLDRGNGVLIVGGRLTEELGRSEKLMTYLAGFNRAGRKKLRALNDEAVRIRTEKLRRANVCHSDDPHIVALIQMSKCELIFSRDRNLHKDVQNRHLLDHGVSIYQCKDHDHLLTECNCGVQG